jgi:signal transduction histidine kinase
VRILGDELRLEQVVGNLLRNALLYGDRKPILIALRGDETVVTLTITDSGIGVPQEHQARIFERFERAVSVENFGGLGLGLYIAKEITLAHGGTISLRSTPGQGAAFTVTLPRRPSLLPA